jgi:hypothetical protein
VVFGFWAFVLMLAMALVAKGRTRPSAYAESRQYTEPLFVFVVMVVAASRPVLEAARAAVLRGWPAGCRCAPKWRAPGWAWRWCRWPAR